MNGASDASAARERPAITPDDIVRAALAIIDEDGFPALSMRAIATRLDVFPTTLYWHVGNRAQVLALVCETVLRDIALPPDSLPWREWTFLLGIRVRQVIGAHPRFASYFVTNIQASGASLRIADRLLAVLERDGFAGNDLIRTYNAIVGAVFGWVSGEFAAEATDARSDEEARIAAQVAEDDTYPALGRHWPLAANRAFMVRWSSGTTAPLASSFELMLTALLDGLDAARPPR